MCRAGIVVLLLACAGCPEPKPRPPECSQSDDKAFFDGIMLGCSTPGSIWCIRHAKDAARARRIEACHYKEAGR